MFKVLFRRKCVLKMLISVVFKQRLSRGTKGNWEATLTEGARGLSLSRTEQDRAGQSSGAFCTCASGSSAAGTQLLHTRAAGAWERKRRI